jgi:hypothetical protein
MAETLPAHPHPLRPDELPFVRIVALARDGNLIAANYVDCTRSHTFFEMTLGEQRDLDLLVIPPE